MTIVRNHALSASLAVLAPLAVLVPLAALTPLSLLALGGCASDGGGKLIRARFDCDDGQRLALVFDHTRDAVILTLGKDKSQILPSKDPGSGMWYAGGGYELRGAGDVLNYTAPGGGVSTRCVQYR